MGKLTNQQRAAIYAASKDGVSQNELAKQYGYDDIDTFLSDNAATRKQVESYIMKERITDYMVSLVK